MYDILASSYFQSSVVVAILTSTIFFWLPSIFCFYQQRYFAQFYLLKPPQFALKATMLGLACPLVLVFSQPSLLANIGISLMVGALIVAAVIDHKLMIIPDRCHALGLLGALLYLWHQPFFGTSDLIVSALYSASLVTLLIVSNTIYQSITSREALGLGDIKLLFWLGLIQGSHIYLTLLVACLLGGLMVIAQVIRSQHSRPRSFAFAPQLAMAAVLVSVSQPLPG